MSGTVENLCRSVQIRPGPEPKDVFAGQRMDEAIDDAKVIHVTKKGSLRNFTAQKLRTSHYVNVLIVHRELLTFNAHLRSNF